MSLLPCLPVLAATASPIADLVIIVIDVLISQFRIPVVSYMSNSCSDFSNGGFQKSFSVAFQIKGTRNLQSSRI